MTNINDSKTILKGLALALIATALIVLFAINTGTPKTETLADTLESTEKVNIAEAIKGAE